MYGIDLMVREHDNILRFISTVRAACCNILEGVEPDIGDFERMILFAVDYADKHHHGKEEQILFSEMTKHLGKTAVNLVQNGMLIEHDLGRLHIADLKSSIRKYSEQPRTIHKLGIIEGAAGYAGLLERHIARENEVVFKYAEKSLSPVTLELIDSRIMKFEQTAEEQNIQKQYLDLLEILQCKYGTSNE